jgi:sulfate transporter 4
VTWWFPLDNIGRIWLLSLKVCAIDVLESISIAKALAYKNNYELKCAAAPPLMPIAEWHVP